MNFGEVSAWALWAVITVLALVLYIRVDLHDWGMVGFTIFTMGACVLLSRSLLAWYGHDVWRGELLVIWRTLVLVGAPVATAGFIAGMLREPPPRRQVVIRLALLALVAVAITVVVQAG